MTVDHPVFSRCYAWPSGRMEVELGQHRRVLRPGGELRFPEHVQSAASGLGRVRRLLDAAALPFLAGRCHTH